MTIVPIESILSSLTILLTTIASLRAASRLEARIANGGAIGLMDGPPILGPFDILSRPIGNKTIEEAMNNVSPLWEQSEGFRRAVVLGLLCQSSSSHTKILDSIFQDVVRQNDDTTASKEDELAIAAAIEAGLLVPTRGGSSVKSKRRRDEDTSSSSSLINHPVAELTSWFIRELSAPFSAIPAWHGMLCSFLRQQKKIRQSKWTATNIWKRWRGTFYDSSECDFDALISGVAKIPSLHYQLDADANNNTAILTSKSVKVKAYAPNTFRDLRNRCFRVSEREYARSVLNLMGGSIAAAANYHHCEMEDNGNNLLYDTNDVTMSTQEQEVSMPQILQQILGRKSKEIQTLPYISFQSNSKGAARAGTFFFFTADGAYMIKTVKKEEARAFLEMLSEYHKFMSERSNGKNSLLTRFFGMYSVQFLENDVVDSKNQWNGGLYSNNKNDEESKQVDCEERVFLVMNSVFPAEASAFVTERFDLKGSTVGRECSLEEQKAKGANAVLKDLNLKREVDADRANQQPVCGIHIGKQKKCALMAQLKKDVDLLHRCGVLDYSLLVGSADMEKVSNWHKSKKNGIVFPKSIHNLLNWMDAPMPYHGASMPKIDGGRLSCLLGTRRGKQVTYYLGIIDFLQPWTVKKRLERDLKGLAGYDTNAISCVAPSDYAARFLKFMDAHIT
ncbi:hypothetical protein ACHAXN_011018 [Cyclotella atomus]